jgi:hypothetical protein
MPKGQVMKAFKIIVVFIVFSQILIVAGIINAAKKPREVASVNPAQNEPKFVEIVGHWDGLYGFVEFSMDGNITVVNEETGKIINSTYRANHNYIIVGSGDKMRYMTYEILDGNKVRGLLLNLEGETYYYSAPKNNPVYAAN